MIAATAVILCAWPGNAEGFSGERRQLVELRSSEPVDVSEAAPDAAGGSAETPENWAGILQELANGPETADLVAKLGALLQQGDVAAAKQLLATAVETGTLAILMIDHIQDPALQGALQAMAGERQDAPPARHLSVGDARGEGASAGEGNDAVGKERIRADAALEELRAAREQLAALSANEGRVAELEQALEQEKERAASAARELGAVQDHLAAVQKSAAEATRLKEALEQERRFSTSAGQELEVLKKQFATLQASASEAADLENSAAHEKRRADAALQQLNALKSQLSALRASELRMQDEFTQERERSASSARHLEAAHKEIAALAAKAANAAEIENALRREREMRAAALRDLDSVKGQIAVLAGRIEFIPAALVFQAPLTLSESPADNPRDGAGPKKREDEKRSERPRQKDRQASLPRKTEEVSKPSDDTVRARMRDRKPPTETRAAKQSSGGRQPSAASDRTGSIRVSHPPRLAVREDYASPGALAPELPAALLPDDRLWRLY